MKITITAIALFLLIKAHSQQVVVVDSITLQPLPYAIILQECEDGKMRSETDHNGFIKGMCY